MFHRLVSGFLLLAASYGATPLPVQRPPGPVKGLDATSSREVLAQIEKVIAIIEANPALAAPPQGIVPRLQVDAPRVNGLTVQTRLELKGLADGPGILIWINNPVSFLPDGGLDGLEGEAIFDERGIYYLTPVPQNRPITQGYPTYRGAVVLSKPSPPLFVPVTKEEHLKTLLRLWPRAIERARRENRKSVWDRPKGYPYPFDVIPRVTTRIEAELASLTPAERRLPACFGHSGERPLLMTSDGKNPCTVDRQIAIRNPEFFGKTLEPSRIHVITVSNRDASTTGFNREWQQWTQRFVQSLNYAALSGLIQK